MQTYDHYRQCKITWPCCIIKHVLPYLYMKHAMPYSLISACTQQLIIIVTTNMTFDRKLNAWTEQDLMKAAEEEFDETPKLLKTSLEDLKSWLAKSPHLKSICQDDQFLTTFLRGCKYSLERTKEKLDNFHAVKACTPEWFDNWDPLDPAVQEILNDGLFPPTCWL